MARQDRRLSKGGAVDGRTNRQVGGRWRLRNWRLRTKLLAVLLIPTLTVLALIGLYVKADLDHANRLAETAAHGRVDTAVNDVVHELQRERDLTVRFVAGGRKANPAELRGQQGRVDAAIGAFAKELDANEPRLSAQGAAGLRQTQARLDVLTGLRFGGERSAFPADAVLRSYSELVSGILDLSDQAVSDITDPELGRLRLAANALARIKDEMSTKRALLAAALEQGTLSSEGLRALLGANAELNAVTSDFRKFSTPAEQRMYDDTVIGLIVDQGNNLVEAAITRAENGQNLDGLDPGQWDTAATYTVNLAYRVQQALQVQTQERCDTLAAQARTSAIRNAGIVLGVLLLCVILAVIIARSLLRPLRLLRLTALDVAEHRLPAAVEGILADRLPQPGRGVAPVPVYSREELGQVARAFDAVHGEAVRLAGEQALLRENINAMFVNLSRRTQELVERQLAVLDRMEAEEQDSETLGGLFELDHLATRMRRNSENLLVLSGHDLDQVVSGPVAAEEIIGAAVSEVEHYQRIELAETPELAVRGEACSDLVHVISELLENATLYSPADTMVTVVSSVGEDGAWHVHITDRGAGMPGPEIKRANARLADPPEVDVEVSRRMGLFVVATLARRHDIAVRLSPGEDSGLVATVVVPASLLDELPAPPAPPPIPVAQPEAPEPVEEEPEPVPEEPLILPEVPDSVQPRRAPVEHDPAPAWPQDDDDLHLQDDDEPTEQMAAYQEVLSQWFQAGARQAEPEEPVDSDLGQPEWWQWPTNPPWPETVDLNGERVSGELEEPSEEAPAESQPAGDDTPTLALDAEAVRSRMARLQNGFDRARHARSEVSRASEER